MWNLPADATQSKHFLTARHSSLANPVASSHARSQVQTLIRALKLYDCTALGMHTTCCRQILILKLPSNECFIVDIDNYFMKWHKWICGGVCSFFKDA